MITRVKPLSDYRYWIFDLDGTLTKPVHDFDAIRRQLCVPSGEDILAFIAEQDTTTRQHLNTKLIAIEESLAAEAVINSGVFSVLEYLANCGCQLGIFTRNKRHCVDITLQEIGCLDFFDPSAIVASEMNPPKPAPAGIDYLVDLWGADRASTVIIGDYRFDLEAGKAANITTVHYKNHCEDQWPELTDIKVNCFRELLDLLKN